MRRRMTSMLRIAVAAALVASSGSLLRAAEGVGLVALTGAGAPAAGAIAGIDFSDVRVGPCLGGFDPGDSFAGGAAGQIVRRTAAGEVTDPWVTLPAETGVVAANIYQDRACALDGDLIVVASSAQDASPSSRIWRVTSDGAATLVASIEARVHGVVTLANDALTYGPVAGRIVVAAGDRLYAVAPAGDLVTVGSSGGELTNYATSAAIDSVDLDLVPAPRADVDGDGDLIGVDAGNARLLTAAAAGFAPLCGNLLVTSAQPQPGSSGLASLSWNGTGFDVSPLANDGPESASRWTAVAFRGGADCRTCSGVIGNYLWRDLNGDGVRDAGEPAIAGVPLTLTRADAPAFRLTVSSEADGAYQFTGLCSGVYVVTVPPSAALTTALAGGDRAIDSNSNGTTVSLATDGDSDLTIGFGFR